MTHIEEHALSLYNREEVLTFHALPDIHGTAFNQIVHHGMNSAGKPALWVMVDTERPLRSIKIVKFYGTESGAGLDLYNYIGTVLVAAGDMAVHIFATDLFL
jgi:hypothetical protein